MLGEKKRKQDLPDTPWEKSYWQWQNTFCKKGDWLLVSCDVQGLTQAKPPVNASVKAASFTQMALGDGTRLSELANNWLRSTSTWKMRATSQLYLIKKMTFQWSGTQIISTWARSTKRNQADWGPGKNQVLSDKLLRNRQRVMNQYPSAFFREVPICMYRLYRYSMV